MQNLFCDPKPVILCFAVLLLRSTPTLKCAMSDRQPPPIQGLDITDQSDRTTDTIEDAPRVVVVDDDPGIQLLLRETLAEAGFDVMGAESGSEAIGVCSEFKPDLVLLDINMPVMDGITACAEIRKNSQRDFPIIMVTSVDDAVSIQRAFDAGATDFIVKPINWPLFQRRLDSVLAEWQRSRELDETIQRVQLLQKVAPEHVMLVSRSGLIIEDLKQRSEAEHAAGQPPTQTLEDFFGAEVAHRFRQRISGVLKTGRHNTLEFSVTQWGICQDYEAQFLVDGRDRVIIVVQNADADKDTQSEIYDLAFYDPITRLPNRHSFNRFAEESLIDAGLHGRSLVLVSLCFDDTTSDELDNRDIMLSVARNLSECLIGCRDVLAIGEGDNAACVARMDTNRFALTLLSTETGNNVSTVCDQIAQRFADPIESDSGPITIAPRLGLATYPADGQDLQSLMHAADAARHEAYETGKTFCFSSQAVTAQNIGMLDYGSELRQAMDDGQLELHYQPRLSMPDGAITCVEALLRWNHPMRGFVEVSELLHLAKATGLIVPLGNWVLQTACEEAQRWQCVPPPRISINLSQQEFTRRDLADRVIETLNQAGLEPHRIDLELTEAALLRTKNGPADLEKLKGLGVGLVLDDFGTGHTSLAHLKQYPIDALKIDGSFVRDLPDNEADAAICEVIIMMAHKLGMKAVAEGVETQEQLDFLHERGCDEFQGFHICTPLSADEIEEYLKQFYKNDR